MQPSSGLSTVGQTTRNSRVACQDRARQTAHLKGKRIIVVFETLELGGAERQALLLSQHLAAKQGAEVQVWGFNSPGRAAALCDEYGIAWRLIPLKWPSSRAEQLHSLVKFTWALRQASPDVVLPYTMLPNLVCGLVWRWSGARVCIWNQRDEGRQRRGLKTERLAVRRTPWFVSNSHHGANFLIEELRVARSRVRVIRNGIQVSPLPDSASWRGKMGIANNCFTACMIANLHRFKDHVTLLQAWRQVVEQLEKTGRSSLLLLAGRFDDSYKSLKSLTSDLELGESVRFLGPVSDVSGLLSAVDLGVFSSRLEGCPNGVLECMSAGLAIAATDIAGIREAVEPGGYEFLAPPGDAEALADCILKLALNPELRTELGARNLDHIRNVFNPERMCEEMSALISDCLRARSENSYPPFSSLQTCT